MSNIYDIDFSINTVEALLWQYNNSEKLQSLVFKKQEWYDENQRDFWESWTRDVFDIRTANDFGLRVWSIILGVPLTTNIQPTNKANFGFGSFNKNFNNGNFGQLGTKSKQLTTEQKRTVLRLRYFQMISRGTVPETNRFLNSLFGPGSVYVRDTYDMSYMVYVFTFKPDSDLAFLLDNMDLLPRPAAVGVRYTVISRPVFGFGDYNKNFNNSTFHGRNL